MSDDLKLELGLDLKALEEDVKRAESLVDKLVKQPALSGGVGGAGDKGPIGGLAASFAQLKRTIDDIGRSFADITKQLEAQNKLWEKQLASAKETHKVVEGSGGGAVTAGGGSGVGPGGADTPNRQPSWRTVAGRMYGLTSLGNMAAQAATQYADAAWRNDSANPLSWAGSDFFGATAGTIGAVPIVGGMLSTGFRYGAKEFEKEDRMRDLRYEVFRDQGEIASRGFRRRWQNDTGREAMLRYGIAPEEDAALSRQAGRAYGETGAPQGVFALQAMTGLGQEGIGLMGALRRGGAGKDDMRQMETFGQVIGVALSTNLERGRWGEAFTSIAKAVQSVATSDVDLKRIVTMQSFIGGMGARFQGDTAGSSRMQQAFTSLATGQAGALSNVFSLQAAGLGQAGVSYADAYIAQQRGIGVGGVDPFSVLSRFEQDPTVQRALQTGDTSDMNMAGFILEKFTEGRIKAVDWISILEKRRSDRGYVGFAGVGRMAKQLFLAGGATDWLRRGQLPDENMDPRRRAIRDKYPFTSGATMQEDIRTLEVGTQGTTTKESHGQMLKRLYNEGRAKDTSPSGVDPASWGKIGADIQGGPSQAQEENFLNVRNTNAPRAGQFDDFFVSSKGEADVQWASKIGHGLYEARDTDVHGKPISQMRMHGSRDIFMPPNSPVYTPIEGTWVRFGTVDSNLPLYGKFGELKGKDGTLYRFLHLGVCNEQLKAGKVYPAGTLVGRTVPHKTGKNPSHLHLEAWKGGKKVDPFGGLSTENINQMYTGFRSLEEYRAATHGASGAAAGAVSAAEGAPSAAGGSRPAATQPAPLPPQQASPQRVDVSISVRDDRVSVTKTAGQRKSVGQPGQMYKAQ